MVRAEDIVVVVGGLQIGAQRKGHVSERKGTFWLTFLSEVVVDLTYG